MPLVAPTNRGLKNDPDFLALRDQLEGSNINSDTFLATDYLNHFNEIAMLLEMLPGMPDIIDEAEEWRPKSYVEHFRDSGFADKELAIAAYGYVSDDYRAAIERLADQIGAVVAKALSAARLALENDDRNRLAHVCATACEVLKNRIAKAGGVIHGPLPAVDQHDVDALFD